MTLGAAMTRATLLVLAAGPVCLAGCSTLAEIAGAPSGPPNRPATVIVMNNVVDTMFVGDSVAAWAQVNGADGRPANNDTTITWVTSNPQVLALDPSHPVVPTPPAFSWMFARGSGQATITAHTQNVTASKVVTVLAPADIAADDHRFAFALADQPSAASYSPALSSRFSSSGGAITVTRDSIGYYHVRFAGLGTKPEQRENVQVTAYGSPQGVSCKLLNWQTDGSDMVVPVHCHKPGVDGVAVDSRYTVLFTGGRAFDPSSPFAFAERLPGTSNIVLDTSETAFNSVTGHILMGGGASGWNFAFPGVGQTNAPAAVLATGVGSGPEHCKIANYDIGGGGLVASCNQPDGTAIAGRPTVMWFTRGRVGHRFGYASTNNVAAVTPPVDPTLTFNSSGGAVTSRRLSAGQWTVTFAGLGRPSGATEIVIVSALKELDHICGLVSWANFGTNDLTVTLQCSDAAGTPLDARFEVLVVE